MYIGKDAGSARGTNQDTRVVFDLVENIKNSDRNIACGNFFTNLLLTRKSLKKAHISRNNEDEQAGTPNGIYSGRRTECEQHSLRLFTRCNDCFVLF